MLCIIIKIWIDAMHKFIIACARGLLFLRGNCPGANCPRTYCTFSKTVVLCLNLTVILFRYHYGPYNPYLGIRLLRMTELLFLLGRLEEARIYFTEVTNYSFHKLVGIYFD